VTAALTALGAAPAVPASPHGDDLSPDIRALMAKPGFEHAQWGLLELDDRGRVVHSRYPDQFFVPGSTAKLVSVSGAWHTLGSDHRFTTPVQASAAATARC
jgi:D-alanyl-D-alanine carboxypeptidase/D-alanyl-D-alanine-endopeptidase (penicillin-binding protein 4)